MPKTEQKSLRFEPAVVRQAEELGRAWAPVAPLSLATVLAECVKRVHAQETKQKEKAR